MSLVPFEKPQRGRLPDPFREDGREQDPQRDGRSVDPGHPLDDLDGPEFDRVAQGGGQDLLARPLPTRPDEDSIDEDGGPAAPRPAAPTPLRPQRGRQGERVLPFRSRRRTSPFRRTPWRRWLRPFAAACAIVATPVALVAWLFLSPRFALQDLRVTSGERVSEAWVEHTLSPFVGRNLFEMSLAQVESRLIQHPWVDGISLSKELPTRLSVRITERQPVALCRCAPQTAATHGNQTPSADHSLTDHSLSYVDAEGRIIAPFGPRQGSVDSGDLVLISLLPRLSGPAADEARQRAVAMLREIQDVEPSWLPGLSEIAMLGEEDFKVFTSDLSFPLLVRAGTLETRARRLEELLPELATRFDALSAVDLRFARRIIVQPHPGVGAGMLAPRERID